MQDCHPAKNIVYLLKRACENRLFLYNVVFYVWIEVEGSIRLCITILGRESDYYGRAMNCNVTDIAIRSALGLPTCKNNCYLCQSVAKANSRI